ncbi:hypothetical protein B6D29_00760 [Microgenomates bacterium UTCPR1]|nr:MAG: hypothetical protein B6D29_00760 [Microgenomates bacterium UTCPR1]
MKDLFKVRDFYSAIILRSLNIPILRLEKESNRFVTFIFDSTPTICEQILSDYWDRKLRIEPRRFIENINELKTRVHEVLDG